jgi:hypothetical protein
MGFKIERTVSVGNVITIGLGCLTAAGLFIGWYYQTQAMAAEQTRNKAAIVDNRKAVGDTAEKMRGIERKVDVLQERTKYIQDQQRETNEKLDRLIDMQLRRPR